MIKTWYFFIPKAKLLKPENVDIKWCASKMNPTTRFICIDINMYKLDKTSLDYPSIVFLSENIEMFKSI